ncbi:hypothetical protein N781_00735 [Pontibacillus halophilus JSM 076056 = DSM 19796]|uniref:Uncharacterized protein n=1 Tax=Pontibacillus halophilus JSM 076056 = DSM 19796 TaxID=1385510 RepID=A0A0A5GS56_9BACI|nr:hypothetical protein [Pontibacillus halophilus]KGX94058.1 hypothetical protein N781_00735 [Pontibacillus halophilus JSM 076056 = DSM 19796]
MPEIWFKGFEIQRISDSSGVFSGTNQQYGFSARSQRTEGQGAIDGDYNLITHNKHVVMKHEKDQEDDG